MDGISNIDFSIAPSLCWPDWVDQTKVRTQRQLDTQYMRHGIEDWCASYPAAGDILKQLGDAAINSLVDHVLLAMHPRVTTSMYDPGADYDIVFGTCY